MIIVDRALEKLEAQGTPVRVGMIGAGFMAKGVALQLTQYVPGIRLVAVSNRNLDNARNMLGEIGVLSHSLCTTAGELEDNFARNTLSLTEDPMLVCDAECVDVILEVTGAVEFGAHVVMRAIENRKHVVMMNAELDSTLGPVLKHYADKAGVVITNVDGDQPGVIMNLFRFVKGMGVKPVLCGNIKGLQDPYRNPTTQEGFARQWKQKAPMVTSFADGSKISFEQAIVANATGMKVAKRGMHGLKLPPGTRINDAAEQFPLDDLLSGSGIVDYVVGADPGPGVFVLGTHDHPLQQHYLNLYKLGEGPLYCFYTPYHLCHFEVHNTIARAAIFQDPVITPDAGLMVDVVATAKTDLKAGSVLDGIGYYMTYGECENADTAKAENLLPMGLAEGCTLKRDLVKDTTLGYADVEVPVGRLCDKLRAEQALL